MEKVLAEIDQLVPVLNSPECSTRDKAAAASFLSQCHMGIENILKRILVYCGVRHPSGPDSHIELIKLFGPVKRPEAETPALFDEKLFQEMSGLRRLRHFVLHGYSFVLDREILRDAACRVRNLVENFKTSIERYLHSQPDEQ